MAYEEKYKKAEQPNNIILEGRRKMLVSGVENVESFDENMIVLYTTEGVLVIHGEELHIEKLNLDGGELNVEGHVDSLSYEDDEAPKGGLLSRFFK